MFGVGFAAEEVKEVIVEALIVRSFAFVRIVEAPGAVGLSKKNSKGKKYFSP